MFESLQQQINSYQIHKQSPIISVFSQEIRDFGDLLSWLKAQQQFPQFYFNYRDSQKKMVAVGKVRSFSNANSAQQFLSKQNIILVGGLTFDCQGDFWLPRLLIEQKEQHFSVRIFVDNQADWTQEKQHALQAVKMLQNITALSPLNQPIKLVQRKAEQTQWCDWVSSALQHIQQGIFSKVVLANETCYESDEPINAKDFLAESEHQNIGCYHFLYAENAERAFVGSTPERLYQRTDEQLKTEALAGTAAMTNDVEHNQQQANWLLRDRKNDDENLLVVQDICDNLHQGISQIQVSDVELKQLRQVQHLRRQIQAQLKPNFSDADCLQAIHPTAAVSGFPRQSAVQFLKKTENFDRAWYAGTLGVMSRDETEFCVTIRSAFIEQNQIRIFAGAGIVAGSEPQLEWQEIERKAAGLLSLLGEQLCP